MEKLCTKCKQQKVVSTENFPSNHENRDGFSSWCRQCHRNSHKQRRIEHSATVRKRDSEYRKTHLTQYLESSRRWKAKNQKWLGEYNAKSRKKINATIKMWQERNRDYHHETANARAAVLRAIKAGKLIRPAACSRCNKVGKTHAHHHHGYTLKHLLDVIFLCTICHREEHRKMREAAQQIIYSPCALVAV